MMETFLNLEQCKISYFSFIFLVTDLYQSNKLLTFLSEVIIIIILQRYL